MSDAIDIFYSTYRTSRKSIAKMEAASLELIEKERCLEALNLLHILQTRDSTNAEYFRTAAIIEVQRRDAKGIVKETAALEKVGGNKDTIIALIVAYKLIVGDLNSAKKSLGDLISEVPTDPFSQRIACEAALVIGAVDILVDAVPMVGLDELSVRMKEDIRKCFLGAIKRLISSIKDV